MNPEQAWQSVLGQLQMEMPRASLDTWVRDTRVVSYADGSMTIGVNNAYARDWLDSRLSGTVCRLLVGMMDKAVDVAFVVSSGADTVDSTQDLAPGRPAADTAAPSAAPIARVRGTTLNPRYTFDNFVVGANNRLAHAASLGG